MKKIISILICITLIFTTTAFAGKNILPAWDTYENGEFDETWYLSDSDDWEITNLSGVHKLSWTAADAQVGFGVETSDSFMRSGLWHYLNVTDSSTNYGTIFGYDSITDFFMVYCNWSSGDISIQQKDGTSFTEIESWAESLVYSEINENFSRSNDSIIKSVYNPYNGTIRWKIWDLWNWSSGAQATEPEDWLIEYQNDSLIKSNETNWGYYTYQTVVAPVYFGNFHVANYKYETYSGTPYMRSPEISIAAMGTLTDQSSMDDFETAVSHMNSAWTSSFFYDQDPARPNSTMTIGTAWNRTSVNETFSEYDLNQDWLTFNVQVTPDIDFDNESSSADWITIMIDKDNSDTFNSGDVYFKVNAKGDEGDEGVNATWFKHDGDTWVAQQTNLSGDSIYFFESDENYAEMTESEYYNNADGWAERHFASTALRADAYEQWYVTFNMDSILPCSINNFISQNKSIGINLYGYGTLSPFWSWSQWHENNETWYDSYQSDANEPALFGDLYLSGGLLSDEEPYINLSDSDTYEDYGSTYESSVWHVNRYVFDCDKLSDDNITTFTIPSTIHREFWFGLFAKDIPIEQVDCYGINITSFTRSLVTLSTASDGNRTIASSVIDDYDALVIILNPSSLDNNNWIYKLLYKDDVTQSIN